MAFDPADPIVPSEIGDIEIVLTDYLSNTDTVTYSIQVLDASDNVMKMRSGNLIPQLDPSDTAWLQDFVARMRAKAETEILP